MLYHLLPQFADVHILFNVFRYLTFRAAGAVVTALLLAFILGPRTIRWLTRLKVGQVVRTDGPETHLEKAGTPTMGGTLIIMAAGISTLLWAELTNWYTVLALGALLWMGLLGFLDDYLKVVQGRPQGLVARYKMAGQLVFGLGLGTFLVTRSFWPVPANWTMVPFFADHVAMFWVPAYVAFVAVVVAGSSNAVNLTDGLDGLAILPTVMVGTALGIIAYLTGHVDFAEYLHIPYVAGSGELAVFCGAIAGAGLGFLWFNTYPAQGFMGDVGALALGAALGTVAVITRHEIVFFIMGGIFVLETVSVILQVASFKLTGKRIFRMAPIHHHYELKGWPEPRVIVRFWIITVMLVLFGLATLKLR